MGTRILLLLVLTWIMRLQTSLFTVAGFDISGRDVILIGGGLFLIGKATLEIHESLEGAAEQEHATGRAAFLATLIQIGLIDIVFSLDSVITAVGLVDQLAVMILAIVLAVGVMMFAAGAIGGFVDDHPTIKMLALAFLVLIGLALIAEGVDLHIPKGYIYFAMAFAVTVEMLNLRLRRLREPVHLRKKEP
jgi:predicted tellurium resistance membrane protein TerC